jgi:hypothetical protein
MKHFDIVSKDRAGSAFGFIPRGGIRPRSHVDLALPIQSLTRPAHPTRRLPKWPAASGFGVARSVVPAKYLKHFKALPSIARRRRPAWAVVPQPSDSLRAGTRAAHPEVPMNVAPTTARTLALVLALLATACSDERFTVEPLAVLEVDPSRVEFVIDGVAPGQTETRIISLANVGERALAIRRLEVLDPERPDADGPAIVTAYSQAALPFNIAPAPSRPAEIELRYTRRDDVPRQLELRITSNDARRPIVRVIIDIRRADSQLIATPNPVSFPPGEAVPATKQLRLLNNGLTPLRIHKIDLFAESAFTIDFGTFSVSSANVPFVVDPPLEIPANAGIQTLVRFAPTDGRAYRGRMVLWGNGSNTSNGFTVDLLGNDTAPCIDIQPPRIGFGVKAPSSRSEITFDIRNCGTEDLDVHSIRLTTAADATAADLMEIGANQPSSDRFSLNFAGADRTIDVDDDGRDGALILPPGERVRVPVVYRAGPAGSTPLGAEPIPDRGLIVVRSDALAPLRVIPVEGATEGAEEPPFPEIPGCEWTGTTGRKHDVQIKIVGDDIFRAWLDGSPLPERVGDAWWYLTTYDLQLDSGCYTFAVEVWDTGGVLSGMIASVTIDGVVRWKTGDNLPEWIVTGPEAPPTDWHTLAFEPDPTVWKSPVQCNSSATAPWGSNPGEILRDGARWVWWSNDCKTLQRGFFRLTFTVN